jgi:hypothetical protein
MFLIERGVELLNFGALLAFMGVNIPALTRFYFRRIPQVLVQFCVSSTGFSGLHAVVAKPELACEGIGNCLDADGVSLRCLQYTRVQAGTRKLRNSD